MNTDAKYSPLKRTQPATTSQQLEFLQREVEEAKSKGDATRVWWLLSLAESIRMLRDGVTA